MSQAFGIHEEPLRAEDLALRLRESEETIHAISYGEVDAVVVNSPDGPRVYTLEGADHPYRVMVEQMREATVTLGPDRLILYANPQFAEIVEAPAESVTGTGFDRFLPPADAALFMAMVEAAAVRGHRSGELSLVTASGELIPVLVSVTLLEVAGMATTCVIATDLREQRRNEAVVKEEQLSRLILEQAGEAIIVIDPHGMVVRRSTAALRLTGAPALLKHFDDAFPLKAAGTQLSAQGILFAASTGRHIRGLEATMFHPDGRLSSLLVSASPLWSQSKELLGCVVTLTDISERKRAEEVLTRQATELARSNSDLRQFAYSASHDLREPLRQVAVFSEILQKNHADKLGAEAGRLVEYTVSAAHRMERLLQDLLAYTQAADAPQEVPAPTDAGEVLRKTVSIFESQIAESRARLDCGPLPVLDVHEGHLIQLFQNLISNALKYRSEEAPVIRISAQPAEEMWTISVSDNGIGIDAEYREQVFGIFKRLHGVGKYSGNGIGLAICQKIVQRYGGRIWVEPEPGGGSRFQFTLPGANRDSQ